MLTRLQYLIRRIFIISFAYPACPVIKFLGLQYLNAHLIKIKIKIVFLDKPKVKEILFFLKNSAKYYHFMFYYQLNGDFHTGRHFYRAGNVKKYATKKKRVRLHSPRSGEVQGWVLLKMVDVLEKKILH